MTCMLVNLVLLNLLLLQRPDQNKTPREVQRENTPTRELLNWFEGEGSDVLIRRGEAAFDDFAEILSDNKAEVKHVERTFSILCNIKADRSRFHDLTLARLGDRRSDIRREAVRFLAHIGSEGDTAPVAVLLLDGETMVRYAAAKTLAAIGGKRDLIVFDLIIRDADRHLDRDGKPVLNGHNVKHYTSCRETLEKRLKDAEAKDVPKAPAVEKK